MRRPPGTLKARRFSLTFQNPDRAARRRSDGRRPRPLRQGRDPGAGLSVARQDLAGVATRQQTFRNPTDTDVVVPAAGFGLAGTLTTPPAQGRLRHPAVVLVAGSGPVDRDATVAGIPLFAQLAGQLAERDSSSLRYDKRGVGQSGGRTERVTLRGLRRRRHRGGQVAGASARTSTRNASSSPATARARRWRCSRRRARRRSPGSC